LYILVLVSGSESKLIYSGMQSIRYRLWRPQILSKISRVPNVGVVLFNVSAVLALLLNHLLDELGVHLEINKTLMFFNLNFASFVCFSMRGSIIVHSLAFKRYQRLV